MEKLARPQMYPTSQSKTPKTNVKINKHQQTEVNFNLTSLDTSACGSYVPTMFTPVEYTKWNDRLCFDIALRLEGSGEDIPDILQRHSLSATDLAEFSKDPVFDKKVRHYRDEIREKGITFRLKARAQAEELLTTSWSLIHDPDVSAAVKADLIKSTVKWAGLETKGDTAEGGTGGVSITINLGGEKQDLKVVDAEPA